MSIHLTYAEAVVTGLVQGVTELFPVSSLGHNVLLPALIGGNWAKALSVSAPNSPYLAFVVGLHVATAVAMMTAVGIMVGSFRQTVVSWMDHQLPADLYLRPAGKEAPDRHPTLAPGLPEQIAKLPGVAAVDRLHAYELSYQGMPVTMASMDVQVLAPYDKSNFFS